MDSLDLYSQATDWTSAKVHGAADQLDAPTPCDEWDVRTLVNHMLDTQHYFTSMARGEEASPPGPNPTDRIGADPAAAYDSARTKALDSYSQPGVVDKMGPGLGIAFADSLLHGWDLATATNQDATMPDGLADAALSMIHGRFTDEQRPGVFKPAITVADDASPQDKLLAYTGRAPR